MPSLDNYIVVIFCLVALVTSTYILFFQDNSPANDADASNAYVWGAAIFGFVVLGILIVSFIHSWVYRMRKDAGALK